MMRLHPQEKRATLSTASMLWHFYSLSGQINNKIKIFLSTTAKGALITNVDIKLAHKNVYSHRAVAEYFSRNRPVKCPVKALQQR